MKDKSDIWHHDSEKKILALNILNKVFNSIYPSKIQNMVKGFILRKYGGTFLYYLDEIADRLYSELVDYIIKRCLEIYNKSSNEDEGYEKIIEYLKNLRPNRLAINYLQRFSTNLLRDLVEKIPIMPFEDETYEEALDRVLFKSYDLYEIEDADEVEETENEECLTPRAKGLMDKIYKNLQSKLSILENINDTSTFSLSIIEREKIASYDDFIYSCFTDYYLDYVRNTKYSSANLMIDFYVRIVAFFKFMSNFIVYEAVKIENKNLDANSLLYPISVNDVVFKSKETIENVLLELNRICSNDIFKSHVDIDGFLNFVYAYSNTNLFALIDSFSAIKSFYKRMIEICVKHYDESVSEKKKNYMNNYCQTFAVSALSNINKRFESYMTSLYNFYTGANKKVKTRIKKSKDIKSLLLKAFYFYFYFYFDVLRYQTEKSWFRKLEPVDKAYNIVYKSVIYEIIRSIKK